MRWYLLIKKLINQKLIKICKKFLKLNQNISIGSKGILNNIKLRYLDEPVRHKILDLIGDLALLGLPIRGHIIAKKVVMNLMLNLQKK